MPPEEDKHLGNFEVSFDDESIVANYEFSQEGNIVTAEISIRLEENNATIRGGQTELGLHANIAQIDCQRLQALN